MSRLLDQLAPPGRTPDGHVIVRLDEDDYARSFDAGARRLFQNLQKVDAASYRNGRNQPEHIAQPLAVMCEVAVARHLGLEFDWDLAVWKAKDHNRFKERPDVGNNIEVRRVRHLNGRPSLRPHQVGKGLILFAAYNEPPEWLNVRIIGARPYDDAWALAEPAQYETQSKSGSRTLHQSALFRCTCFTAFSKHTCPEQPHIDVAA